MEPSDDQLEVIDRTGQRLAPPPFKKATVLGDHRPHELSTIQVSSFALVVRISLMPITLITKCKM